MELELELEHDDDDVGLADGGSSLQVFIASISECILHSHYSQQSRVTLSLVSRSTCNIGPL